jgi:subtilisin family serine protease
VLDHGNYADGKVIVCTKKALCRSVYTQIGADGAEKIFHPKKPNKDGIRDVLLIHLRDNSSVILTVEKLSTHPDVVFAEPNYLKNPHIIPDDPFFFLLWGMGAIKAPLAWSGYTPEARGVTVGVLDSGIDIGHPDLCRNLVYAGEPYDNRDETGHGTHVAGTIGAVGNNGIGVAGVCWRVGITPFKLGDRVFDLASAIKAIDYANINGIPILNNSWGSRSYSEALKFAIEQYDGLFIASAGNDGTNNDVFPSFPDSYDAENIISVAASMPDGTLATFSNYGAKNVDIAAPGANIFSTALHGGYSYFCGTSMSAPHVSGAAALLKAYRPGLTALEMKHIILSSAERNPALSGKISTGGVLDVNAMLKMA